MLVNDGEILSWRGSTRPVPKAETQPLVAHGGHRKWACTIQLFCFYHFKKHVNSFLMAIHFFSY